MLDTRCKAALKLADTGKEKAKHCNGHELCMEQYLSLLQENERVGMKTMQTEQYRWGHMGWQGCPRTAEGMRGCIISSVVYLKTKSCLPGKRTG